MKWLERLDIGEVESILRKPGAILLPTGDLDAVQQRKLRYRCFSRLNNTWNLRSSAKTHETLQNNPEEWEHYHTLYRESWATWGTVPYEEMVR